ncbi:MAG: hypothetical protein Q7J69_05780 [Candidatus Omnitrophota bacterium]|nr:hypothetical protein [Candidatus Omnitrophota bacterium]
MKAVYVLMAVCLVAGLALTGCCSMKKKACPPGAEGHAAGDACCADKAK